MSDAKELKEIVLAMDYVTMVNGIAFLLGAIETYADYDIPGAQGIIDSFIKIAEGTYER